MKRILLKSAALVALVSTLSLTAHAGEKWVDDWKAYAEKTGESKHAEWVKAISDPKAVKLAKDWAELRGYTASSLIAKANLPKDLKPGLVITKDNVANYPWLKDYLPQASMDRVNSNDWFKWDEIVIVPTNSYYLPRTMLEGTRKLVESGGKTTATPEGNLLTAEGKHHLLDKADAIPFMHPKNGLEVLWDMVAHGVTTAAAPFEPMKLKVCNNSNKVERKYELNLFWKKFHNRDYAPVHVSGREEAVEGGAVFFLKPLDVRGLSAVRLRYADADRDDNFRVFIPSLRRTRTLAGSDGQDPLAAGLEITWDDWRSYWPKTDPRKFDYELVREGFVLSQPETGHVYNPNMTDEAGCEIKRIELELRPVWVIEVTDKTGQYLYSKRRIYVDKEYYYTNYQEMYDRRGNLFRLWDDVRDFKPSTGQALWKSILNWNPISNRLTRIDIDSSWDHLEKGLDPSLFDIEELRDYR